MFSGTSCEVKFASSSLPVKAVLEGAPMFDTTCFTVLGMFFFCFWFCSFLLGVCNKTKLFATIPRVEMLGLRKSGTIFLPLENGEPEGLRSPKAWLSNGLKCFQLFKANRPFELLLFPFWPIFSRGPNR